MQTSFNSEMSANLVMMLRSEVDGALWLVNDDEEGRFYEGGANKGGRVIHAFGTAVETLQILTRRGARGVFAVTRGKKAAPMNLPVFRPDLGDTASVLLASRCADRVLGEVGGAAWLTACGRDIGGVVPRAVKIARAIHRLSSVIPEAVAPALIDRLNEIIDWDAFEIDWTMVESGALEIDFPGELLRSARQIDVGDQITDALIECDGMDAIKVIAAATGSFQPRGLSALRSVTALELASMFRVAFDWQEFESDGVYWRLKHWEWLNKRFAVFRNWRRMESFQVLLDQSYIDPDLERLRAVPTTGVSLTVFQLDLDHFKQVNDSLGHAEGDEAIRLCEVTVARAVSGRGDAYRRGGDEIVGFVLGGDSASANGFAEALRADIEAQFRSWAAERGLAKSPTASIGLLHVTRLTEAGELAKELDAAQLRAKQNGRNCVVSLVLEQRGAV